VVAHEVALRGFAAAELAGDGVGSLQPLTALAPHDLTPQGAHPPSAGSRPAEGRLRG